MNQDQCLKLISLYAASPWLWDANDPHYMNKRRRESTWSSISRAMNMPVIELRKKMVSLMGSYRREKSREKKSRMTVPDRDDVYKSNWFAYKSFAFISDRNEAGSSRDPLDIIEDEEVEDTAAGQSSLTAGPAGDEADHSTVNISYISDEDAISTAAAQRPTKRARRSKSTRESASQECDDDLFHWAMACAADVRKMDRIQQIYAKKAIADIIMEGQLGLLRKHSQPLKDAIQISVKAESPPYDINQIPSPTYQ